MTDTTRYPLLSIAVVFLIYSTVDWLGSVLF